jgi:hypothetical protein
LLFEELSAFGSTGLKPSFNRCLHECFVPVVALPGTLRVSHANRSATTQARAATLKI